MLRPIRADPVSFTRPDPSVVRAFTEVSLAMTVFSFLLTACFLASVSYAILAMRAWTGWPAVGIAILNLIAVPAIFGGNDFLEAVVAGVTTAPKHHLGQNAHSFGSHHRYFAHWLTLDADL
jgi:membrane-associated protease RseP (regulator of RpoE activity)